MSSKNTLTSLLAGVAGEYYVAAELSKLGLIASITLRNTKGVDVLCSNAEASKTVGIQVKTNKGTNRDWILNQKAEGYFEDNLFYVFVNLNNNLNSPDYFIVPSKVVGMYCLESHKEWLAKPGKKGQQHNDNPMRKFKDSEEKYLNRWDLLGLD